MLIDDESRSAMFAVDDDTFTSSQTECAYDKDIWYKMEFDQVRCFSQVIIHNAYHDYRAYRMNDLSVHVQNSKMNTGYTCGSIQTRESLRSSGQRYSVQCEGRCGVSVMLRVNHDRDNYSNRGCIHMKEVGVHFAGNYID